MIAKDKPTEMHLADAINSMARAISTLSVQIEYLANSTVEAADELAKAIKYSGDSDV